MKTAFKTIQNYDCVGVYEQMSDFISILCSLIEIPLPKKLMMINATANRPDASNIIRDLMRNILEMTELDRDFYSQAVGLVKERLETNPTRPPEISRWMPLDRPISEAKMSQTFILHGSRLFPGKHVESGGLLRIELDFELVEPVRKLLVGLHIFDDRKRWAFGINNLLLDAPFNNVAAGRHRLVHTITTDLPAGEYTAGFSFVDVSGKVTRNLFWEDETLSLEISWAPGAVGLGYSQCYASMTLEHCPSETGMTIRSERVVA